MTTSIKSVNHHENFVKAVVPTEKQIEKLAAFGIEGDLVTLFVNAVNWIVINDNKRKSMKFFKKNQPLVDAGLAETFEEDGATFLKLSRKGMNIVEGKTPKINVSQEPRIKVKQSKGYTAKDEIPEIVQQFLDSHGLKVKSTELTKATFNLKCVIENSSRVVMLAIYENDIKFCFFGKYKQEMQDTVLSKLDTDKVLHTKMSNTFGFILIEQDYLKEIDEDVFKFEI